MRKGRGLGGWLLFAGLIWAAGSPAAQALTSGALRGLVIDDRGAPIPGVAVDLVGEEEGHAGRGAVTDAAGGFQIPALPPGRDYRLRASLAGFATVILSDVEVLPGQTSFVRLTLMKETNLRERVRVRAVTQVVNPETTTTSTLISSEFLDALPILGRNYQDMLTLAPGVTDTDGDGNPNVHGSRDTDIVTLVDGVSMSDPVTGKTGAQLNLESIQEIEVKTAGASAEFGRAQGGFVSILTKSGGNDFNGTFKFFWRGSRLDGDGAGADSVSLHGGVGEIGLRDLTFNDYYPYLSVGGPIVKDRGWFFAALERVHVEEPVNALNQAFLRGVREDRDFIKVTFQAGANHRLALSLNYDPQELLNQNLSSLIREESGYTLRQGGPTVTFKETSVLSPMAALETTVSAFSGRPDIIPNLGVDTNGNGTTYVVQNENGEFEPFERDPGEDYDKDGKFDVFEDVLEANGLVDQREINIGSSDFPNWVVVDEDACPPTLPIPGHPPGDCDHRITPPGGCEGKDREDIDCDGHLDARNEDRNLNGRLDSGEDRDADGRLDLGIEDRNKNGRLDDNPSPESTYPYGRLKPLAADRDYTVDQISGIANGPFYQTYSDRRNRYTLREDLSLFVPDLAGSHDLKMGLAVERETFKRRTKANDILATKDPGQPACDSHVEQCSDNGSARVTALLPTERSVDAGAEGRTMGLYLQDVFKPFPNLSLGLGLRFEREIASSSGFTSFNPIDQRETFDRLTALVGAEQNIVDGLTEGNGDGIISHGILTDPLFRAGGGDLEQFKIAITEPMRRSALSHLTRHREGVAFTVTSLGALFPDLFPAGKVDEERLARLGIVAQTPESFGITNNNLSPRLSISWDPRSDGRTKAFATWGRYFDKLFLSSISGEPGPDRLTRYYVVDRTGFETARDPFTGAVTGIIPNHNVGPFLSKSPPSTTQVDRNLATPFCDEFTLGFEREVAPEVSLALRYVRREYRDQLQDVDLNHIARIDPRTGTFTDQFGVYGAVELEDNEPPLLVRLPDGRPDLYIRNFFFNQILRIGNYNEARYHGIELELRRRLSRRWEMQASYTYSRAQGSAEDFQSKLGNDPSTIETEFGYLDYDQRHVVKIAGALYLPGDWQLGFATSWSSGLPYSVISRYLALDSADFQQFRTRYGETVPDGRGFVFKPLPRNSERNDAFYDINLRARKGVVIGRRSAAFFIEVFNLLNTDDLRIRSFEPFRAEGFDATGLKPAGGPLQLDAERRFGRRFQFGFQIDF